MRRWIWIGAAALALVGCFGAGVALACDGNYCGEIDTTMCLSVDETVDDNCCIDLGNGLRCCMATRQTFLCDVGGEPGWEKGPAYDPRNPGPTCH